MASSDDFREQLKAGNITEALALALSKAVELKITTWVASAEDGVDATEAKPGHRLRTRINMIEGDIENEIGEQFLGYGPYRELRQFHLDQVAESNKIIQSNLKSLQKLFEVLVAMHYGSATAPTTEPELLGAESPLLPPAGFIPASELVEELQEVPPVEDVVVTPIPVVEEDIAEQQPPASEELSSLLTTPKDGIETLERETDEDDWDDSVLELLESLPVEPPLNSEALNSEMDEDWGDLIEEEPESDSVSDLRENRDWGILTLDDFEPPSESLESNVGASSSEIDEDWGDLIEQEQEPDPKKPLPSLESLDLEEEDEWDEWVVEDPDPLTNTPVASRSLLDLDNDEDWDALDEDTDPFATTAFDESGSELELDENWDDFAAEELEPYPTILEFDADAGTGFDSSDPLENLTSTGSAFYETDDPDLSRGQSMDSVTEDSPLEELDRFPQMPEITHQSQDTSSDPMEAFFAPTDSDPVLPDDNGLLSSQDESLAHLSLEDILADIPDDANASQSLTSEEFERDVLRKDSDPFSVSEDELDSNPKSLEKRVPPPPPPPSRFPNQNN